MLGAGILFLEVYLTGNLIRMKSNHQMWDEKYKHTKQTNNKDSKWQNKCKFGIMGLVVQGIWFVMFF